MKKFIAILLASTTILSYGTTVFGNELNAKFLEIINNKSNYIKASVTQADTQYKVFLDNNQLNTQDGVIIYEDKLFLPIRNLIEGLGLDIEYYPVEKVVSINNGKLQLPVNYNKAVVNGNILAIDENNNKIGTILLNGKTYLPLDFISKNAGYTVEHKSETKEIYLTTVNNEQENTEQQTNNTLDKKQALEIYKQLSEVSSSYKNFSDTTNTVINLHLKDSTGEEATLKMNSISEGKYNLDGEISLYLNDKQTLEMDGETETVVSKSIYKDGVFYLEQDGLKVKTPLALDEVIEATKNSVDDLISENFILGGSFKQLDNGNKEYTFNIDLKQTVDFANQLLNELQSAPDALEIFESLEMNDAKLTMVVDSQNNLIKSDVELKMSLSVEDIKATGDIKVSSEYKDINKTVVTIKEDLSQFEAIDLTE